MTSGATLAAPAISETLTGSGLYQFQYGTTQPISFIADGATSSVSSARYVRGLLDPADRADEFGTTLVALGTTNIGLGTTLSGIGFSLTASVASLGSTGSTFGGLCIDPIYIFGYVKRIQEFLESNAAIDKSTGAWSLYSRGSSTLLR